MDRSELDAYLADCRELALREIQAVIPTDHRCRAALYNLVLDYPRRAAKALRPALCIATCRALGGPLESVLRSAAVLELYHNAFLIHDDVEDGSERRRDHPTLHRTYGVPIAVNVGDAMLALALQPLLDNMRLLGMGKALRVLQTVARMARESAEGQALELHWIRQRRWRLTDADYVRMVYKKTSWYTFIAPLIIGGIVAGAAPEALATLRKFGGLLGVAFQIQDDVLNLLGEGWEYGKETAGDLWEGKHTLILMHMMRAASGRERDQARRILSKPRPHTLPATSTADTARRGRRSGDAVRVHTVLSTLEARGELTRTGRRAIEAALRDANGAADPTAKTPEDIQFLMALISRHGSIDYARAIGRRFAAKADAILARADWLAASVHRDFLHGLVSFVVDRDR